LIEKGEAKLSKSNTSKSTAFVLLIFWSTITSGQNESLVSGLQISFQSDSDYTFSSEERARIDAVVRQSEQEVRVLLPELTPNIEVIVFPLSRDVTEVGGVTGRAETENSVIIYMSTLFEGGVIGAANTGLAAAIYHEFHHLVRGWTIQNNKFGPGIDIAAVNEGLANVFSEIYTNTAFAGNAPPDNVDEWLDEILELPVDANYNQWMNMHPDGRLAIGYRTGSYVVREAMAASNKPILELSLLSPEEILALVR